MKINQIQQTLPYGEGYETIREYKLYTGKKGPLLIYSLNENEQIVFEASHSTMMIANEMDMDAQHLLSIEYCSFNGKAKRSKNFVTLTASVYHPMLQKQLPLATMECKSEDSANIGKFWNNFNKAFKGVTKTDKKFYPVGWITDMATANFNGLQLIYDEDVPHKVKGCELHFCHASKCSDHEQFKVR